MKIEKPPATNRKAYYDQAGSWADDVHGSQRRSVRIAWIFAAAAAGVAVLEAVALAGLAPLKTVTPYLITVDRQTGYLQEAQSLKPGALSQDAAVAQAFLAQYVLARETYDLADAQSRYREVAAWTTGASRDQYLRGMAKTNPASPVNVYGASTTVAVTIKSIALLSRNTALVRFETVRSATGGAAQERLPYQATISFRYTGDALRNEDRFLNPLGFQVTGYHRDGEGLAGASGQTAP